MNHILAIAGNTYRESVRNKVFYIVLAFALFLLGASLLLAQLSLEEHIRIIKHFGLFAINVFGLLLALFVGVTLIYEELEKRTIYVLVAHGVPRYAFIVGKFLGLAATVSLVTVFMSVLFVLMLYVVSGTAHLDWVLFYAVALSLLRMLIVISLALLFSSISTPILSAVLTLMMYFVGVNSGTLREVVNYNERKDDFFGEWTARIIYACVPDLGRYDLMTRVSYGHLVTVEWDAIFLGFGWIAIFLMIAVFGFLWRDFK